MADLDISSILSSLSSEDINNLKTMANSISKIPVQIFADYIVEKLRKANPFLAFAVDESAKVLGGSVVHIPQSGAAPTTVKNRSTFPATAVKREDSFVTYALNVFSTDPTHVSWHEENEVSYDKTDSVLGDHVETLAEAVGDDMIYSWLQGYKTDGKTPDTIPAANVVYTTGASRATVEEGQTGNRKKITVADVQKIPITTSIFYIRRDKDEKITCIISRCSNGFFLLSSHFLQR